MEVAAGLLDEHGPPGLTMRRLAQQLGVTATALYWHVKTKDDVLDLALDHVFGEVRLPEPTDDWRQDVRVLAGRWRQVMLEHPWAPGLIGRPMLGPNVLTRTEFLQNALVRGGFTDLELTVVTRLLANYIIGAALTEATWLATGDPGSQRRAHDYLQAQRQDYPTLVASGHLDESRWGDDELFSLGLETILTTGHARRRVDGHDSSDQGH